MFESAAHIARDTVDQIDQLCYGSGDRRDQNDDEQGNDDREQQDRD